MRVIAGSKRRTNLVAPAGQSTRPTTDRLKETLFNILQDKIPGAVFLDLFSGSGGIGIEALSRGAKRAIFVENGKEALRAIKTNLEKTGFQEKSQVFAMDYCDALKQLFARGERFDLIFLDPPYQMGFEKKVLEYISQSDLLNEDAVIIFEAAKDTSIDYLERFGFELYKLKTYKTNKHVFVTKKK